ncbi:MAG: hypothetical protein ACE5J9_08475 [Methanosarcinales archaeon]
MSQEIMYCPDCGTEQFENAKFCHHCGNPLYETDNEVEVSTEQNKKESVFSFPKPTNPLEQKATNLLKVEIVMLVLSPITGGFLFNLISMLDSMILLQAIAFTTIVYIDPNEKRAEKWLYAGIVIYIIGVFAMAIALGYSGIAGWSMLDSKK